MDFTQVQADKNLNNKDERTVCIEDYYGLTGCIPLSE